MESNIPQSSAEPSAEGLSSKNVQHHKARCITTLPLIANHSRENLFNAMDDSICTKECPVEVLSCICSGIRHYKRSSDSSNVMQSNSRLIS